MNIEEVDKWLNEVYGVSYTKLCGTHNYLYEKSKKLEQENERLNNIINELEKWLKEVVKTIGKNRRSDYVNGILNGYVNSFRKLQELKDSDKE